MPKNINKFTKFKTKNRNIFLEEVQWVQIQKLIIKRQLFGNSQRQQTDIASETSMERYYRIEFSATLQKMTLAFKMQCQIEVFWKRGEKVAQTGKVLFRNCSANFDKELTISCNMAFDTQHKLFKEKQTKFAIVIYTQKGNKQAGEVLFDVAPFLNERNKSKNYQLGLAKCPDKNAKISFSLRANIIEEKSFDTLSESSLISVDVHRIMDRDNNQQSGFSALKPSNNNSKLEVHSLSPSGNKSSTSIVLKSKDRKVDLVPTTDRPNEFRKQSDSGQRATTDRFQISSQTIKVLQSQNNRIRGQLKRKQQLKKQNEQLKRKLKDDDYESCKEHKKKIQQGKKQIEQLMQESKGAKKVNEDIKKLQREILKCKQHIMRIFNEAQKFGPQAMDKIQQACGIKEY